MPIELETLNKLILLFINFFSIFLGGWVLMADWRATLNRRFAIMTITSLLWVNFAYLAFSSKDIFMSVFWYRLNYISALLTFLAFYSFYILTFLKEEKRHPIIDKFILISVGIAIFLLGFTSIMIKGAKAGDLGMELVYGNFGDILFYGFSFILLLLITVWLIKKYFVLSPQEKLRVQYFFIGNLLWIIFNTIFNVFSPLFLHTVKYQHFGDYSVIFLLGFTAYAIVKRELFGIKIVLTAFLVGAIAILLGLDIAVFTTDLLIRLYKGLVLIIFLYFGWLLIRSVLREIKMREQIAKAYEVEKKARKELAKLDDVKNQFIMASQHHLRTPLTSMQGYIDLLFGGTYGEIPLKIKETLAKFQLSIKRLIRIINEFLDITQFQLGKEVVMLQPGVQIVPILDEVIEELQLETKARGLYLKFEKPKKIPEIKADSEKLKVALFNIVDNGIKYTKQGGVTVKCQITNSKLQIIVKDTGAGIAKEDLKGLFGKLFERGQEARKVHGTGRGIGLYITSHIIKAHKGRIWAESEGKGKGSTFYIELPVE